MRAVSLGLLSFVTWLLWSGHYTHLLLTLGAGSCLLIVLIARRMQVLDEEGMPVHVGPRFLLYLPWLMWAIARANVDVALRILRPGPPSPRACCGSGRDRGRAWAAPSTPTRSP